jgi:hypothetical protein
MVILKWIQSVLVGNKPEMDQMSAGKAFDEFKKIEKRGRKAKSVDLAHAALIEKAEDFDDLIASGSPAIKRRKLKRKIRSKVEKAMSDELSDPKIIDEVTERIADVAEIDPHYQKLFCKDA